MLSPAQSQPTPHGHMEKRSRKCWGFFLGFIEQHSVTTLLLSPTELVQTVSGRSWTLDRLISSFSGSYFLSLCPSLEPFNENYYSNMCAVGLKNAFNKLSDLSQLWKQTLRWFDINFFNYYWIKLCYGQAMHFHFKEAKVLTWCTSVKALCLFIIFDKNQKQFD